MTTQFNLLLVEDDDLDVLNVQRALRGHPAVASITVARDGVEALDLLRARQVPFERLVILVDLRMPRMNGLELMNALRAAPDLRGIPVVVLTTSVDEEDRRAAYAFHAAGYLLKPIDYATFRRSMESFSDYWSRVEFPT